MDARIQFIGVRLLEFSPACPNFIGCSVELAMIRSCPWPILAQPRVGWVAGTWWASRRVQSGLMCGVTVRECGELWGPRGVG